MLLTRASEFCDADGWGGNVRFHLFPLIKRLSTELTTYPPRHRNDTGSGSDSNMTATAARVYCHHAQRVLVVTHSLKLTPATISRSAPEGSNGSRTVSKPHGWHDSPTCGDAAMQRVWVVAKRGTHVRI
jgi:hypothetical protein